MHATDWDTYARKNQRMIDRHLERAKDRDPILEQNLMDLLSTDARDNSIAQFANDSSKFRDVATEETRPMREYMVSEAINQYRDFYESDDEEQGFFEYLDNYTNRDKIRMMEIFEDYTVDKQDMKKHVMIAKREYNPELSIFSNMVLDLVDFKDRVRPIGADIAMLEYSQKYQKQNVQQMLDERADFDKLVQSIKDGTYEDLSAIESEGYSSKEIEEPKVEAAAEPEVEAAVEEPDFAEENE
jgi:hypothetical protein